MCGRLTLTADTTEKLLALLPDAMVETWLGPRYNLGPTRPVPVVRTGAPRKVAWLTWGLIPGWAKDRAIANRLINARAETVAEKPAFREAYRHRRCAVLADGFYEWQAGPGSRQPFWFGFPDSRMFAIAGLWEAWRDPESGGERETCTLITTAANAVMRPIHHRMPVILAPGEIDRWLDEPRADLLRPCPDDWLTSVRVSTAVNQVRNDYPELLDPDPGSPQLELPGLG